MSSIPWLRRRAVGWSLAADVNLAAAMARLEFVQADPIRAPAPAQDLILRHRVPRYRVGDLHRAYPRLPLDEDVVYAYGFVARRLLPLLHPRPLTGAYTPTGLAADVLAFAQERGVTHPRDLTAAFGKVAVVNAWGGQSAATTRALEELHRFGLLRVCHRENGIRLYEPAPSPVTELAPAARLRGIALRIAELLAPVPESSLRAALPGELSRAVGGRGAVVRDLLDAGDLTATEVDGVRYLWPSHLAAAPDEPGDRVRLLAPFDPVVWDRRRFELLWGWAYRFEAYTPVAKRKLGYYALPLLWRDQVIGWANWSPAGPEIGFVDGVGPRSQRFRAALDAEIARMETFLRPRSTPGLVRPRSPDAPGQAPSGQAASSASTPA